MERKTYAVDLDGTLSIEQENWWEYDKSEPIPESIAKINELHEAGHKIIIYTARFEEDKRVTKTWLKEHGVKYPHLVLGKLRADFYIDNHSFKVSDL